MCTSKCFYLCSDKINYFLIVPNKIFNTKCRQMPPLFEEKMYFCYIKRDGDMGCTCV